MAAHVKFTSDKTECALIRKIAKRAKARDYRTLQSIMMDLSATHANGNPLRLSHLLLADDFSFFHDIYGIARHLDRETGKLLNCFLPRFSAPMAEAA